MMIISYMKCKCSNKKYGSPQAGTLNNNQQAVQVGRDVEFYHLELNPNLALPYKPRAHRRRRTNNDLQWLIFSDLSPGFPGCQPMLDDPDRGVNPSCGMHVNFPILKSVLGSRRWSKLIWRCVCIFHAQTEIFIVNVFNSNFKGCRILPRWN